MNTTEECHPDAAPLAPAAKWHFFVVSTVVVAVALLVGATGGHANGVDAPALTSLPYAVMAAASLLALYAGALVADRLWRTSATGVDPATREGRLADPLAALLTPYRTSDDKTEAALRLEQVGHILRQLDVMMAINVINAILVALALWGEADKWVLAGWLTLIALGAAGVIRSRVRQRQRPPPSTVSKRTLRRISAHSGWRGLAWGAAFALFFPDVGLTGKLVLGSVSVGMLAGGVLALATLPSAALLYGLGVMVPTILRLVSFGSGDLFILAMFGITYSTSMMIVAYQLYYSFATNHAARRAQSEQSATISMLLNEFEASASDWLWEADEDGRLSRLPERMAQLVGQCGGSGDRAPALLEIIERADGANASAIADALAERKPFRDIVLRLVDGNGDIRWMSLTGSPKPDGGYRGVGSDITAKEMAREERQKALERAEQAEQRLKDGIASVGSGFMMADGDGRIRIANEGFYQIFTAARLLGDTPTMKAVVEAQARLWRIGDRHDSLGWLEALGDPSPNGATPADIELPTGRWIRIKRALTTDGGTVMLLTDVSDIKQQEAMLADQARKLSASNQELEQFAAVASHDLQEPLRKIEAFGQRLSQKEQGNLGEESVYFLERMMSATGRMRLLITDLLSYSRVGRREGRHREIDLDRLLADVTDDLAVTVAERRAEIRPRPLGTMEGEPTQLRQLFQNLLSNAFKFAKPGTAPVVEIERRLGPDGGIELRFRDHGIGFDMKHHDKIFEIFQRLHGREQYEGTGIGLATCRKIVERHGGTLSAVSAPGEGATFIASFPAASSANPAVRTSASQSAA